MVYIRDKVNGHFSFRCFNGAVGFARWDGVAFTEDL